MSTTTRQDHRSNLRRDENQDGPSQRAAVPRLAGRLGLEAMIIGFLFLLYNAGRLAITGQEGAARSNAGLVRRVEEALHLPSEAALQGAFAAVPQLFEVANRYYVTMHFPVMLAFLVWGFVARPRTQYLWARNLAVVMTFLGLVIHTIFPLAPPRMFPQWGFLDTMAIWGPSPYDGASASVANQFAAMPSLHIGWALLIAWVLTRTANRPLAVVGAVHAATTVFVVVVTANHWWLDGIVAALLLAAAVAIFPRPDTVYRRPFRLRTSMASVGHREGSTR